MTAVLVILVIVALFIMFGAMALQHRSHKHEMHIMQMAFDGTRQMMINTLEVLRAQRAETPEQREQHNREILALEQLWGTNEGITPAPVAIRGEMLRDRDRADAMHEEAMASARALEREVLFSTTPSGSSHPALVVTRDKSGSHLSLIAPAGTVTRTVEVTPGDLRTIGEGLVSAANRLEEPQPKPMSVWERLRQRDP